MSKSNALITIEQDAQTAADKCYEAVCRLFGRRNQDGTWFFPRLANRPHLHRDKLDPQTQLRYLLVDFDANALYHHKVDALISVGVLNTIRASISQELRRRVRVKADTSCGITYVIDLFPSPPPPPPPPLPKKIGLDMASAPGDPMTVPLGLGQSGPVWKSLGQLGHIIAAGASGSGKSTFAHIALAALLTRNSDDDLKVALIDPKCSELSVWAKAAHLVAPVANSDDDSIVLLESIVDEMNRRGKAMQRALCRDWEGYKRKGHHIAPLIVYVDEATDLVLGQNRRVLSAITAIACRGRSAGVFLWASTQHAAAIAGLPRVVLVNFRTRLCFRVLDHIAAESAGCPGAQAISASTPGRMLARLDDAPVEVQGFWISDSALEMVADNVSRDQDEDSVVVVDGLERADIEFLKIALAAGGRADWPMAMEFYSGRANAQRAFKRMDALKLFKRITGNTRFVDLEALDRVGLHFEQGEKLQSQQSLQGQQSNLG